MRDKLTKAKSDDGDGGDNVDGMHDDGEKVQVRGVLSKLAFRKT